jgi:hypothetical protein
MGSVGQTSSPSGGTVLALLVAMLGIGKRGGFLLHFVVAIALTPVAGIILALVSPSKKSATDTAVQ